MHSRQGDKTMTAHRCSQACPVSLRRPRQLVSRCLHAIGAEDIVYTASPTDIVLRAWPLVLRQLAGADGEDSG